MWAEWKAKFFAIVNSHATIKTKRVRSGKVSWITPDLPKGMRHYYVAKRKAIKSNNPQDWAVYKRLHNKINGEVNLPRHPPIILMPLFSLMATCVKSGKKNASLKELKLNENSVTNSHELSNAFNNHFSTIETNLAN